MRRKAKTVIVLSCHVLVLLGLKVAHAAPADNCTGFIAEVNRAYEQSLEVGNAGRVNSFTSYDIVTSDAPEINGELGECRGTWVASDGKYTGGGYCSFKDKDGDTQYLRWEASFPVGTWRSVGGTGKWADNNNSGWIRLVTRDDKRTLLQWGGTCEK